jgi:hypothetical protein
MVQDYVPTVGYRDPNVLRVKGGMLPTENVKNGTFGDSVSANYNVDYRVPHRGFENSSRVPFAFSVGKISLFTLRIGARDMNLSYFGEPDFNITRRNPNRQACSKMFGDFYRHLAGLSMRYYDTYNNSVEDVSREMGRSLGDMTAIGDSGNDFADSIFRKASPEKKQTMISELMDDVRKISSGEFDLSAPKALEKRGTEFLDKHRHSKALKLGEQTYFSMLNHTMFNMIPAQRTCQALYESMVAQDPSFGEKAVSNPRMRKFLAVNTPFPEKSKFVGSYIKKDLCTG